MEEHGDIFVVMYICYFIHLFLFIQFCWYPFNVQWSYNLRNWTKSRTATVFTRILQYILQTELQAITTMPLCSDIINITVFRIYIELTNLFHVKAKRKNGGWHSNCALPPFISSNWITETKRNWLLATETPACLELHTAISQQNKEPMNMLIESVLSSSPRTIPSDFSASFFHKISILQVTWIYIWISLWMPWLKNKRKNGRTESVKEYINPANENGLGRQWERHPCMGKLLILPDTHLWSIA